VTRSRTRRDKNNNNHSTITSTPEMRYRHLFRSPDQAKVRSGECREVLAPAMPQRPVSSPLPRCLPFFSFILHETVSIASTRFIAVAKSRLRNLIEFEMLFQKAWREPLRNAHAGQARSQVCSCTVIPCTVHYSWSDIPAADLNLSWYAEHA